jgi:peptidoglycan/xylan/chitin deacetylase (PgdA/CDA1 family)
MAVALPRSLFMVSGPAGSRSIALTFDDGPDPEHTPAVLRRLGELRIRATFFVVGEKAEAHPGLVARIVEDGHVLGHHSWSHGQPSQTGAAALVREARRTSDLLERLTGRRPRLFRPPYGKVTAPKLVGLWMARQSVVLWNQDPKDFGAREVAPLRRWFAAAALAGGDILLMHDSHAFAAPSLDALADRAAALGLAFGTPSEWIDG